jgi:hypothetical protein
MLSCSSVYNGFPTFRMPDEIVARLALCCHLFPIGPEADNKEIDVTLTGQSILTVTADPRACKISKNGVELARRQTGRRLAAF